MAGYFSMAVFLLAVFTSSQVDISLGASVPINCKPTWSLPGRLGCEQYFLTQNSAGWTTGERDCKNVLGDSATLLYIETHEELENVRQFFLDSDDSGTFYYTGGMFNTRLNKFVWKSGTAINETWFPWLEGYPKTRNDVTRVVAVKIPSGDVKFKTVLTTVSCRSVCEFRA